MSSSDLRIAVLVSIGRNPVSGAARAHRNDVLALELARRLGGAVTVIHAGDGSEEALKDYLAYGAEAVEVLAVPEGLDVTAALADRVRDFTLVLTGSRAEGGQDSGLLPYLIAEQLGRPVVAAALEVAVAGQAAEITQFLPKGKRRVVQVALPAVIAVHPMASVEPRYAHLRRSRGRVVPRPLAVPTEAAATGWTAAPATRKPVKFKAVEKKAGHARMLSAIVTEAKGGAVISGGSADEKAEAILTYLRDHRLIEF